jgi:galactokinase
MEKGRRELFVPGRLCLFGEHSDWVGGHRRQNADISKGYAIVAPTNQGNYARIRELEEPIFRFISRPLGKTLEASLEETELLSIAEEGGVFSYPAGVAHELISSYQNLKEQGVEIVNYKTDLPIKKGLSSSASICVLVAKAFNEIYNLRFTKKRLMDIAYLGEITTPSRCGRMDQACAYDKPILMTFDADKIEVEEISVGGDFYLLVVDLGKSKDSMKILSKLNEGFPFPTNDLENAKHLYFNEINPSLVSRGISSLKEGDMRALGAIMTSAQKNFDHYLSPFCQEELTAPVLHSILELPEIKDFIWGGKGVGSGGEGSAQLVCKSKLDQWETKMILEHKGYDCFELNIKQYQ